MRILFLSIILSCAVTAIAQEKILRMSDISLPPSFGNPFAAIGLPSSTLWFAMFDALVRTDESGELEPALALRWTLIDPTRWRFYLRPGVFFSNGESFNAETVAATMAWLKSDDGKRMVIANELKGVRRAEVVDSLTIDMITDQPDAILPKRLTAVPIVARDAWAKLGVDRFALEPVGTGPFVLADWGRQTARAVLKANHSSWRPPIIDELHFLQQPDMTTRIQALMSGQVDLINTITPDVVPEVQARGFTIKVSQTPQVFSLAFNTVSDPNGAVGDVRVRRALNYAVNKEAIAGVAMMGLMTPASQGASPVTFGYNPSLNPYTYDPEKAKALLAQAGYGSGLELEAEVVVGAAPGDNLMFSLVQQDLRAIGVNIVIRGTVFSDWLRKYLAGTFEADMFGLSWNGAPYYDAVRAMEYFSCAKVSYFFCEPNIMPELLATGRIFDTEERRYSLQTLAGKFRDLAPAIFLIEISDIAVLSPVVRNFRVRTRVPVYEEIDVVR